MDYRVSSWLASVSLMNASIKPAQPTILIEPIKGGKTSKSNR